MSCSGHPSEGGAVFATQGTRLSCGLGDPGLLAHLNPLLTLQPQGPVQCYPIPWHLGCPWELFPHTLLAQLSPQCFPTAQGPSNVSVQLTPSPTEPGASGMGLLPQQGWAQSFKMHKTCKAAASWWITSMVLRWTEFISYDLKILFLWRSIMVTCDFNDFTDD